jgi:hypothetical protein
LPIQVSVGDTLLAINDIWIHDKEVDIIERLSVSVRRQEVHA